MKTRPAEDRFGLLERDFLADLPGDSRLESGVPADQRASAMDFINMSGLTRSGIAGAIYGAPDDTGAPTQPHHDMDPSMPVSFYEEGVEDVDDAMGPPDGRAEDEVLLSRARPAMARIDTARSIEALKDLVADLARDVLARTPVEELEQERAIEALMPPPAPVLEAPALEPESPASAGHEAVEHEGAGYEVEQREALEAAAPPSLFEGFSLADAPAEAGADAPVHEEAIAAAPGVFSGDALLRELGLTDRLEHRPASAPFRYTPDPEPPMFVPEPPDAPELPNAWDYLDKAESGLLTNPETETDVPEHEAALPETSVPDITDWPDVISLQPDTAPVEMLERQTAPSFPAEGPEVHLDAEFDRSLRSLPAPVAEEIPPVDSSAAFPVEGEGWNITASVVAPDEPSRAPSRAKMHEASARLAEAEQLLQELEQQPRDLRPRTGSGDRVEEEATPASMASGYNLPSLKPSRFTFQPQPDAVDDAESKLTYSHSAAPVRRRSRRHSRRYHRTVRRVLTLVFLLIVLSVAGLLFMYYVQPALREPDDFRELASAYVAQGDFEDASESYLQFAMRYPGDPMRADAQFNAAYALQQAAQGQSVDGSRALREKTLQLYAQFVEQNPSHPKRVRAETIMGILQFELGNYDEAEALLRRNATEVSDPDASLPIVRTLARVYLNRGEFDRAESTFLQAAILPKNYSADEDYEQLGQMFSDLSRIEEDPVKRAALHAKVNDYWEKAIQVPGIDPGKRKSIERWLAALGSETPVAPPAAADSPVAAPAGALAPSAEALAPDAVPGSDAPTADPASVETPAAWEQDAAAETRQMELVRGAESADKAITE
ncbi:MAG: tetratricopeptide repeat protein [Candidatus Hydrogenedentes bacterium]|nr:tetratricopeptide repeat protein [Candidatus Hydrogenedentota bacterium]